MLGGRRGKFVHGEDGEMEAYVCVWEGGGSSGGVF